MNSAQDITSILKLALRYHREGNLDDAKCLYQRVLGMEPQNADALHLLGLIVYQEEQYEIAVRLITQAIQIDSTKPSFCTNLGNVLQKQGKLEESIQAYRKAIRIQPDYADAYYNLGNVLQKQGKLEESIQAYRKAIRIQPDYADTYYNLGNVFQEQGKLEESIRAYQKAIQIQPDYADTYYNLGNVLQKQGKLEESIQAYHKAIQIQPNHVEALFCLGVAFKERDRLEESIQAYQKAIAVRSDFAEAYNNLGNVFQKQGKLEESIQAYQKAIAVRSDFAEAYYNLGNVLQKQGKLEESIQAYHKAIQIQPNHVDAYNDLGVIFKEKRQLDKSIQAFQKSIRLNSNFAQAHENLGMLLLLKGDFLNGWKEYEWRWRSMQKSQKRDFKRPLWDGTPLDGKSILVYAEQGFGDTIQFIRYIELLPDTGTIIIFACQPELKRLFKSIDRIDALVTKGEVISDFDVHIPLLSLPYIFNTTLDSIPSQTPYLYSDINSDFAFILDNEDHFKVGIVWAGSSTHVNDRNRSVNLNQFKELLSIEGCEFFSLQVGLHRADISQNGYDYIIKDLGKMFNDFRDTASAILQLDLVISVDTSVAHLAGALGKEVWTLLPFVPDWRWMFDRSDSPWYPSMTLFRQKKVGNWGDVFQQLKFELMQYTQY